METENQNPQEAEQVNDLQKQQQMVELNAIHSANFQRFLEANFNQEQLKDNEEALDLLYKAFCQGFNSGMVHSAGVALQIVGIDLNSLQPRNIAKEEAES